MFEAGKKFYKIFRNPSHPAGKTGWSGGKETPGIVLQGGPGCPCGRMIMVAADFFEFAWIMAISIKPRPTKSKFCFHCCHCCESCLMLFLHLWAHRTGPSKSRSFQLGCVFCTPRGAIPRSGARVVVKWSLSLGL